MKRIYEDSVMMELLADCTFEVLDLVRELRKIIFDLFGDVEEKVNYGWRGIRYTDKSAGHFVGIFPHKDHVRLGFEHGSDMIDKYNLFMNTSTSQVRYIKIKSIGEMDKDKIREYLRLAVNLSR